MSSINNVGGSTPVNPVYTKPVAKPAAGAAAEGTRGKDRLELSGLSPLLKTLKAGGDIRADKVAAIKAQIEAGTYEDDKKLDAAVDRLLDDLAKS
jgi:anti-sigma28 factor (negative regulator of flagellin synthesis)